MTSLKTKSKTKQKSKLSDKVETLKEKLELQSEALKKITNIAQSLYKELRVKDKILNSHADQILANYKVIKDLYDLVNHLSDRLANAEDRLKKLPRKNTGFNDFFKV